MSEERKIVIASRSGISIRSLRDLADAIGSCMGTEGLVLEEGDLSPEFFVLKSGFAGEVMQKFVNYRIRLAVIVPRPAAHGERFRELVDEHRSHPTIRFVRTMEEAEAWLSTPI